MALLQSEDLGEAQVVQTSAPRTLTREQKLALLNGGEPDAAPESTPEPIPDRLRSDVTFAGSEGAGKTASGLFPRTAQAAAEGKSYGRQVLGAGLDLLSLPGRALAATGRDKGDGYLNSMADQEGKSFVGKVLRDPATGATVLTAPLAAAAGTAAAGVRAAGLGAKLLKAGSLGSRLAGAGAAGAAEGVASAAAHQAENVNQGKDVNLGQAGLEVGVNALLPMGTGVLGAGAKKALSGLGWVGKAHGNQVITSTIRPNLKDMKDGFRIQNVFKNGLEGTLEETQEKLGKRFDELSGELAKRIDASTEKVDLVDILDQSLQDIGGKKAENFGSNQQFENVANQILEEINTISPNGVMDLATAQQIKRRLGKMGAWAWGKTDPESNARETLSNTMYSKLRQAIEDRAPEGVKEINQQISELIPIERAVVRRIPVEARNSGLSLSDLVTGSAGLGAGAGAEYLGDTGIPGARLVGGALAGIALSKARKSPTLAGKAYRLGERLQGMNAPRLPLLNAAGRRMVATENFSERDERE